MRRFTVATRGIAAVALLTPFALAGCGSSNRTVSATPAVSPFTGSFVGSYTYVGAPTASGPISITIDPTGKATGTAFDYEVNASAAVSGTVKDDGTLNATFAFSDSTFTATGTLSFGSNGHLVGTIQEYYGTQPVGAIIADLTRS